MTGFNAGGLISIKYKEEIKILDCFGIFPYEPTGVLPHKKVIKLQFEFFLLPFEKNTQASTDLVRKMWSLK